MGGVEWRTGDSTVAGANRITAAIRAEGAGTFNATDKAPTKLIFSTHGTSGVDPVDRMKIDYNGDISFYDSQGSSQSFFWDASAESLGIGTSSPAKSIEIRGGARIAESTGAVLDITPSTTGTNGVELKSTYYADGYGPITFNTGNTANRMVIDSSGNVDIGSTGGSTKLSIAGGVGTQNGTEAAPTHTFYSDSNTGMYRPAADHLGFSTGGSEAMRIDSSGNVGIGTASPSDILHIESSTVSTGLRLHNTNTGGGQFRLLATSDTASIGGGNLAIYDQDSAAYRFVIDSSGNVGIGTSSPSAPLHIHSTSPDQIVLDANSTTIGPNLIFKNTDGNLARIASAETNTLRFEIGPSNTEAMRIDSSGNLLVGKTTDNQALAGVKLGTGGSNMSRDNEVLVLNRLSTDGTILNLKKNGTTVGSIASQSSGTQLSIETGSGNEIRVSASGALTLEADREGNGGGDHIDFRTANSEAMRIDSSGSVLINTASHTPTDTELVVSSEYNVSGTTDAGITLSARQSGNWRNSGIFANGDALTFTTGDTGVNGAISTSEKMRIDSSGNVGINTSDPVENLTVGATTTAAGFSLGSATTQAYLRYNNYFSGTSQVSDATKGSASISLGRSSDGVITFNTAAAGAGTPTEAARFDSSGNLLVGTTTAAGVDGVTLNGFGYVYGNRANAVSGYFDRGTSDGDILEFRKDGSTVGSIGTTSGDLTISSSASSHAGLRFSNSNILPLKDGALSAGGIDLGQSSGNYGFKDLYLSGNITMGGRLLDNTHIFANAANTTEYARIDSSGNLLLGTTSINGVGGITLNPNSSNGAGQIVFNRNTTASTSFPFVFQDAGGAKGSISYTDTATAYNTSSDYRLKTDAQPITGASARVQALNPVNFEWITDGTRVDGFLAHEAQAIVPEAVTGAKDAMRDEEYEVTPAVLDDDGNVVTEAVMGTRSVPDYQGIDQSKLVPLLTAALQEALTKIDALETRITALEG
jgi:hypothetical protein